MTNSDDSLYKFISTNGVKSQPGAEGSTRKQRKCIAACVRTNKNDRCADFNDTSATSPAAVTSVYCSDVVQKTCRQHDKGLACIKTTADCHGQCTRTGKYGASDNPQCTDTRSYRANDSQSTSAGKYMSKDGRCTENYSANNKRCTGTGNCRAKDGQCAGAGKCGTSDNPQCTSSRNYRANDSQCSGNYAANNNNRCISLGSYKVNDSQCTVTAAGKYGTKNCGCNGCSCISAAAAAVAAAACLGGANAFGRDSPDTLMTSVYRWAKVAVDWTWDKAYYFLVAAVSFFLGMYTAYWCLCICEEAP